MSQPIVFISRNKIKEGKADEFRKHYQNSVSSITAGKPGTLAQLAYKNEKTAQVTIVRLFPYADALDQQLKGAAERSKITYEFIEPISIEIFGSINPTTLDVMKQIAGLGVAVSVSQYFIGGFIR